MADNTGGRPQVPHSSGPLLNLDDSAPAHHDNVGNLLDQSNVSRATAYQPRPSTSYDDFVGGQPSNADSRGAPSPSPYVAAHPPYLSGDNRTYSQTSGLNNYQRYSDIDDFPDDDRSIQGGFYGGLEDGGSPALAGSSRKRNSARGMGAGILTRAKNMLGMGSEYTEMDMPLRESGPGQSKSDTNIQDGERARAKSSKFQPKTFKFGFGGGKQDASPLGPRIIYLNNPPANSASRHVDNHISTAKYNVVTFLPKFLFEQFSKYANLFFLFTAALQQIPNISPTNRYTTIGPLILVLLVSAGKELIEDFKRKNSDKSLNFSKANVLRGSNFESVKWVNVAVGDIVRVESEESFPADLVLLASSEPEGLCYIETANLDGETNLKIKQAIPETATLVSPTELSRLSGRVRSEQPNSSLYTYEATLTMTGGGGEKELPLAPDQLLLRGATLRNTPWVYGIVVFTGHETKLMRNATATPIKRTQVERMVNIQILMLVSILITLSIISSVGDLIVRATAHEKLQYLYYGDNNGAKQFFSDIFTYWVLYSNLVPISLFVTIEVVKYYHAFLINSDLDIYYDRTDTPAICRTSSLVEELGQIEYIFSDKTGTLTCNVMEFRQCSIGGVQYGDDVPEDRRAIEGIAGGMYDFKKLRQELRTYDESSAVHQFMVLLAICHTVIPERNDEKPGDIKYQAASPDEGALVEGAVMLGYRFIARKPRLVTIKIGEEEFEYELLAVCEFNSTRKRMSTIFRCPDGKVRCYCKGADTVILERLSKDNPVVEATLQHLEEYATEGLRTLCLAMREIPEQELQQWLQIYEQASTTISGNRAEELDKAAEIIEHDFTLLGATAIEDKLQDGVPDTIHTLQEAGIKVWVLTGDRQETAINIGMSCKLISEDMTLLIVNEDSIEATRDNLTKKLSAITSHVSGGAELETLALVIDGKSLTFALEKSMEKLFLDLAVMCKAVICCRVSPLQKALVVKLVKRNLKAILLAIGDGANDVSMIQAAHVGVGISGVEGLQAARSADVAIGQFRYLRKLLLVHGAWSYQRISKVILYSFYKNIALYMTQFWTNGTIAGHWVWGTALYTAVLATVLGKAALVTNIWTKYTFLAIPGSMIIWLAFIPVYGTVAPKLGFSTEYAGVIPELFTLPAFYLMAAVLPVLCLLRDLSWKYAKRMHRPQVYHYVQEIQKFNIQDYRPRMEQFQKAIRKVRQVQRMRKQRGYAFSQADESQNRVLQAYDTTRERGRYGEMASSRQAVDRGKSRRR
ncbi:MAG: hypothetical protein LQ342_003108 [Letrouitia transgressa]|nr:MAG: hypothetical protein LQ342_003108 [Letrouitia transgressa]